MSARTALRIIAAAAVLLIALAYWHLRPGEERHDVQSQLARATAESQSAESAHEPFATDVPLQPEARPRFVAIESPEIPATDEPKARGHIDDATQGRFDVREFRAALPNDYPDLGTSLGLSATEEEALYDLLAAHTLERFEMRARNSAEQRSTVEYELQRQLLVEQHAQQLQEQLGYQSHENFKQYQQRLPERLQIHRLRSALAAADMLSSQQEQKLLDAMYEERQRFLTQMRTLGVSYGYTPGYPFRVALIDSNPEARLVFAEAQLARTEKFLDRLHDQASSILSSEQLRRLDQIHARQLAFERKTVEALRLRLHSMP